MKLLLTLLALLTAPALFAAEPRFDGEGIQFDAGSLGKFTIPWPQLTDDQQKPMLNLRDKKVEGDTVTLIYNGAEGTLTRTGNEFRLKFASLPREVKNAQMEMLIPIAFNQGGSWALGDKNGQFPKAKPATPHLFQGHAQTLKITNYEGRALTVKMPEFSFLQLTDNREWNWATFNFRAIIPMSSERLEVTFSIEAQESTAKAAPLVDEFGQGAREQWPSKMTAPTELREDLVTEKKWTPPVKAPPLDAVGGLEGSGKKLGLKKTGYFHLEQRGERSLLVDPLGNAFFHLAVCGVNPGEDYTLIKGRESAFAWIPPREGDYASTYRPENNGEVLSFHLANWIRKHGQPYTPEAYAAKMIPRLKAWGFNSYGAFSSGGDQARTAAHMPYVLSLPINAWEGIPRLQAIQEVWDPFDESVRLKVQAKLAQELPGRARDPLLIGYFIANEPIYENIPHQVPAMKADVPAKQRLVRMLSEKYQTIAAFNTAWKTSAADFAALLDTVIPVETPAAKEDMAAYTGLFLEEYFSFITKTFRQYDTAHLLLGSRLMPGTIQSEQLCRIMGKYVDVMSFNYYTDGVDRELLRRVHGWTGKPFILSEFYWGASKESGLTGGREVQTQQERGLAYRNYVEQAAATGLVVGIEWFTLIDQAVTGRWFQGFDGERANTGLIAVTDRPWYGAINEMAKTNLGIYSVWLGGQKPFVFQNPRFGNK